MKSLIATKYPSMPQQEIAYWRNVTIYAGIAIGSSLVAIAGSIVYGIFFF